MQDEKNSSPANDEQLLRLTSEIVASFVSNNVVTTETLPDRIRSVYRTMLSLVGSGGSRAEERLKPAVPISKSVSNDHIICL
jgi:predicted transcriptional regulator